jgi:hypothetical protein
MIPTSNLGRKPAGFFTLWKILPAGVSLRPLDLEPLPREAERVRGGGVWRGIVGLMAK